MKYKRLSAVTSVLEGETKYTSKIAIMRKALPDTPDGTLRGILKDDALISSTLDAYLLDYGKTNLGGERSTVLVIGDLHAPFIADGYLDHCLSVYESQGCDRVVQIGDALDNHASSYHETETDALGVDDELGAAVRQLKPWADAFPHAVAVLGNHDRIIQRKATSSRVSSAWIRKYNEVIGVPWEFYQEVEIDGVTYRHEVGSSPLAAATNAQRAEKPLVGGHIHTKAGVVHQGSVFGCLTGVGVDRSSYAMRYAKLSLEPYQLSCAVVYEGQRAAVFPMN